MPRLVLHTVMCEVEVAVNFMGPDCSSWGLPARSTSMRNFANSYGAMHLGFVFEANMTVSRSLSCDQCEQKIVICTGVLFWTMEPRLTLICMVILAKHAYFVFEQPGASILFRHQRWDHFLQQGLFRILARLLSYSASGPQPALQQWPWWEGSVGIDCSNCARYTLSAST